MTLLMMLIGCRALRFSAYDDACRCRRCRYKDSFQRFFAINIPGVSAATRRAEALRCLLRLPLSPNSVMVAAIPGGLRVKYADA